LRFETGDVYPPYSSFRADPLGTKALLQSLGNLRGITVQRYFKALDNLREGRGRTLFVLGAQALDMEYSTEEEYKTLEQFMFDGGRIVISFAPSNTQPTVHRRPDAKEEKKAQDKPSAKESRPSNDPDRNVMPHRKRNPANDEEDWPGPKPIALKDRWNVSF